MKSIRDERNNNTADELLNGVFEDLLGLSNQSSTALVDMLKQTDEYYVVINHIKNLPVAVYDRLNQILDATDAASDKNVSDDDYIYNPDDVEELDNLDNDDYSEIDDGDEYSIRDIEYDHINPEADFTPSAPTNIDSEVSAADDDMYTPDARGVKESRSFVNFLLAEVDRAEVDATIDGALDQGMDQMTARRVTSLAQSGKDKAAKSLRKRAMRRKQTMDRRDPEKRDELKMPTYRRIQQVKMQLAKAIEQHKQAMARQKEEVGDEQ